MERRLVIGYGNELRRDDGAGPRVAREVERLGVPGIDTVEAHQLLPEHAELISRQDRVVFVDASLDGEGIQCRRIEPSEAARITPHASDPEALLALAGHLFGHVPDAWLVTVPAADLGLGEGLSAAAEDLLPAAVRQVMAVITEGIDR